MSKYMQYVDMQYVDLTVTVEIASQCHVMMAMSVSPHAFLVEQTPSSHHFKPGKQAFVYCEKDRFIFSHTWIILRIRFCFCHITNLYDSLFLALVPWSSFQHVSVLSSRWHAVGPNVHSMSIRQAPKRPIEALVTGSSGTNTVLCVFPVELT